MPRGLTNRLQRTPRLRLSCKPVVTGASSDYGRACAAVTNQHMALISVGTGQAMVLADPPLSAWGRSPEGWIDIYSLEAWPDTNTDAMVKRAVAATATSAMTDTGKVMTLKEAGLVLLFAGDKPGSTAYMVSMRFRLSQALIEFSKATPRPERQRKFMFIACNRKAANTY